MEILRVECEAELFTEFLNVLYGNVIPFLICVNVVNRVGEYLDECLQG